MASEVEHPLEENLLPVIVIMLMRLYDVQMTMLGAAKPELAAKLMDMHTKGEYFCPPPALAWDTPKEEEEDK